MALHVVRFSRHDVVPSIIPPRPAVVSPSRDPCANGNRPLVMRWITVADSRGEARLEARWVEQAGDGSQEPPFDKPGASPTLSAA